MKTWAVDVYVTVAKTFMVDANSALSAKVMAESEVDDLLMRCSGGTLKPLQDEGFETCDDDTIVKVSGHTDEEGRMVFG